MVRWDLVYQLLLLQAITSLSRALDEDCRRQEQSQPTSLRCLIQEIHDRATSPTSLYSPTTLRSRLIVKSDAENLERRSTTFRPTLTRKPLTRGKSSRKTKRIDEEEMYKTSSESRLVGDSCRRNTDCVAGAFCETGSCRCWGNHVEMKSHCWKKVNPEESGCTYDVQCDAIWPGSYCQSSICKCPLGKVAAATREGAVCHSPGQCPTGGVASALLNRNSLSLAACFFFDGEEKRAARFIGCDDFPEVYECIEGLCCPSRALTCIQSADSGDDGNETTLMIQRWYYDSITGSCQQFNYSGHGGNANNFLTRQQCESYCEARCTRGQPQLDTTNQDSDPLASMTLTCQGDSDCDGERFSCTSRGQTRSCCPKPEFICSELGGLLGEQVDLTTSVSTMPYSAGSSRAGIQPATRWYWDGNERRCRSFQYLGQGGNFNNFLSEQHCLSFCTKALCQYGSPLRISSGSLIECSISSQCPRSHHCLSGACCPTPATICNQPLAEGIACLSEEVARFWFDPMTGSCQPFAYKGCQGNANNFNSLDECQTFCSQIEEEPKCPVGEALRLESGRFWKCGLRGVTCPNQYECHFDGHQHGCCPTQAHTCSQNPDEGRLCSPGVSIRWFYDNKNAQCRSFSYRGCDGNSNNFVSQQDCEEYCVQKLKCPPSFTNPFEAPQFCSPLYKSCQDGHECVAVTSKNYVCCAPQIRPSLRILITRLCGEQWKPVMASSGEPRRCDTKLPCDTGSMCRFSEVLWLDICCRPDDKEVEEEYDEERLANFANNPPEVEFQIQEKLLPAIDEPRPMERPRSPMAQPVINRKSVRRKPKCKPFYTNGEPIDRECRNMVFPGEDGCDEEHFCMGQSRCVHGKCLCHPRAVLFNKVCYWKCPHFTRNHSGICLV